MFRNLSLGSLANEIESLGNIHVVDQTSRSMAYDFDLNLSKSDLTNHDWESVNQSLVQIGLELVQTNMPMKMLIVDKVN